MIENNAGGPQPVGPITQIGDELGRIFRHMLPGLLIVGAAAASQPSWFGYQPNTPEGALRFDPEESGHLAMLAAIAFVVGNTWYVIHRYTLHQIIDFVIYWVKEGENWKVVVCRYVTWLTDHTDDSFRFKENARELHRHVTFRSAQVIYMFIAAEVAFVFGFVVTPESGSPLAESPVKLWMGIGAAAVFVAAFFQYVISHSLDVQLTERHRKSGRAAWE